MATVLEVTGIARRKTWLDRSLCCFTEVHAGEAAGALLLAANVFCLLASYYLVKTVREALILSEGGAEVKSYSSAVQAMILLLAVPAYGAVASRVNRLRLINGVTLFFVSHLLIFHHFIARGVHAGIPFFLWAGVFNLMVVAQFWSFANDLYTCERGKRLFPLIGVGGSLGAWAGAKLASRLLTHAGPDTLLLVAAAGLLVCVALNQWASQRERSHAAPARADEAGQPLGRNGGFQLILTDRYLRLIALLVVVDNIVNTIGEFLLGKLVVAQAAHTIASGAAAGHTKAQLIGIFYGDFFAWVNLLGFVIQLLLVSRIFKTIGVQGALFVLPLVSFATYSAAALMPVLGAVGIGKMLENSTDYSLQNTARHALFLPTSREAKYKAKQAIDAFCWRLGDLLQAVVVFAGVRLALGVSQFAMVNQMFIVGWLAVAVALWRKHRKLVKTLPVAACLLVAVCAPASSASAQETRAAVVAEERAEKARETETIVPPGPGVVARMFSWANGQFENASQNRDGFYPELGGMIPGAGFSAGPGYRHALFGDGALVDFSAAASWRRYTMMQSRIEWPRLWTDRLSVGGQLNYQDFTQINFFGIGNGSSKTNQTDYRLKNVDVLGFATVRANRWLSFGGRMGVLQGTSIAPGTSSLYPSTGDSFGEAGAPGLTRQPGFLHADVAVDVDTLDVPGYPSSGGRYRLSAATFQDREYSRYSFQRVDAEIEQYVPLAHRNWILALRGRAALTQTGAGQEVPFYLLPALGGATTLRGFLDYRFRDRDLLLLNAEYRWPIFGALDGALFYDAGAVAATPDALRAGRLNTDYGMGFRFHSTTRTVVRLDVARGREGSRVLFTFAAPFGSPRRSVVPYVP
jgi:AAA family ATP:ADP antiporter